MMAGPMNTVTGATMTAVGRTISTAVTPLCMYYIGFKVLKVLFQE